jgi:hypothetical protein
VLAPNEVQHFLGEQIVRIRFRRDLDSLSVAKQIIRPILVST